MKKYSIVILVSLLLVSGILLTSEVKAAEELPKKIPREKSLVAGDTTPNYNPFAAQGLGTTFAGLRGAQVYMSLAYYNRYYGRWQPRLADNWGWVDNTTFEVNLRPEARFRKGEPVTAEDLVFTENATTNPKFGGVPSSLWKSVEAVDEHTVHYQLYENKAGSGGIFSELSGIVFSKERWLPLLKKYGENIVAVTPNIDNISAMNGTGPYMVAHYEREKEVLRRVDNWWGNEIGLYPLPKYIIGKKVDSNAQTLALLEKRKLDFVGSNFGGSRLELLDIKGVQVWNREAETRAEMGGHEGAYFTVIPNLTREIFQETYPWLMKALNYASDVEHMNEAAFDGFSAPISPTYLHPDLPDYDKYVNKEALRKTWDNLKIGYKGHLVVPYSPNMAIKILENHCEGSPKEGWWYPNKENGEKLGPWTIPVVNGWSGVMTIVQVMSQNWSDIGIKTQPAFESYGAWSEDWQTANFDWIQVWKWSRWGWNPLARTFNPGFWGPYTSPWSGNPTYKYARFFSAEGVGPEWGGTPSRDYPELPNTAKRVHELARSLWKMKRGSEEYTKTVKKIQSIVIPQVASIFTLSKGGIGHLLITDRWVNNTKKQDPYVATDWTRGALVWQHVFPKSVKTTGFKVTPGIVKAGETFTAKVSLKNEDDVSHKYAVYLRKGKPDPGRVWAPDSTTDMPTEDTIAHGAAMVPANGSTTLTLEASIEDPGSYTLNVDEWRIDKYDPGDPLTKNIIVEKAAAAMISPSDITLSKAKVEPGESTKISVDVSNNGDAEGSETIEITLDGETLKSETVTLKPGEMTTVTAEASESTEGTYTVKAGELTRTFTVKKREVVIPPGLEDKVTLAIRMAENARSAAVSAGSSAQAAKSAANEAKETAQKAVTAAQSAKTSADEAKDLASEAKDAASAAKTAAQEAKTSAENAAPVWMVWASMIVTIIVVLAGVYVITGKRAT